MKWSFNVILIDSVAIGLKAVCDLLTVNQTNAKKMGRIKKMGERGGLVRQKAGACVRNSWFLVTVEPASV